MSQEDTPQEGQTPDTPAPEPEETKAEEAKTFDEAYVKKLREEAAASRKRAQEAEAKVSDFEERDKSELEKLTGKLTKAEQRAQEAQMRLLRFEVAAEKGLDPKVAAVLSGQTREELEAAADVILGAQKPEAKPEFDGGARDPAPPSKSPEQAHTDTILELIGIKPK